MTGVLVLEHEPAEAHVVAGGVLDALQNAVLSEAHEHGRVELGVNAHGKVIGEQGKVGVLANSAKMTFDFLRAAERVERSRGDKGVDTESGSAFGLIDHAHGLHIDDAREHRHATVDDGDRLLQHMIALRIGEKRHLSARAEEEQSVDACVDHAIDRTVEGLEIEGLLRGKGDDHGRNHAAELGGFHTSCLLIEVD